MTISVQGAWTRQWVSIDGGEAFETQRVYWLQAGECYADLRVPFHPAARTACFAGRSGWDGDRFRWAHRLDLDGDPGHAREDVAELDWDGERLIERGRLDGDVAYQEVWVRLPGGAGEGGEGGEGRGGDGDGGGDRDGEEGRSEAQESPTGCHIRVGDHAITIDDGRPEGGDFHACYRFRTGDDWQVGAVIGDTERGALTKCGMDSTFSAQLAGQDR